MSMTDDAGREQIAEITAALNAASLWLVLIHEKPDGDAIGSAVALARVASRLGKRAIVGSTDEIPSRSQFICDGVDYRLLTAIPDLPDDAAIVCVDTSNLARTVPGLVEAKARYTTINIDHHGDNERFGHVNWVDERASASGELVTTLIIRAGWGLKPDEARALYVALITDNGNFSFASTSLSSHLCAIELLKAGASPSEIAEQLEAHFSSDALHLWGRAFLRAEVFGPARLCALFWLTNEDFAETGTMKQGTESLVNYLLKIKGVRVAALCSETEKDLRVSLRTRVPFNARTIASVFGGGGHELAAGCMIARPTLEAISLLKAEMERHAGTADRADSGPSGSK